MNVHVMYRFVRQATGYPHPTLQHPPEGNGGDALQLRNLYTGLVSYVNLTHLEGEVRDPCR
jgi:hypothetical protein